MSKKANPTLIGLFVVIGLLLGVAGVVTFGAGKWFQQTEEFIIYFDSSVRGLNPGSSVTVAGVRVGQVKEIRIHYNQRREDVFMPVLIEIDHRLLNRKTDRTFTLSDPAELKDLVDKGLRARLQAESLLTGVLYVDLSILPDPPPATFHQLKPIHKEIPSAPNEIQRLMENLAHMDIRGLSEKLDQVLVTLNDNLNQLQMEEISSGITNLLTSMNALVDSRDLTNAVMRLNLTLEETQQLAADLRTRMGPVADGASRTLAEAQQTLSELRLAVEDVRGLLAPEAPLRQDLSMALDQISHATRSIGDLADFLSRNPNALLSGRKPSEPTP